MTREVDWHWKFLREFRAGQREYIFWLHDSGEQVEQIAERLGTVQWIVEKTIRDEQWRKEDDAKYAAEQRAWRRKIAEETKQKEEPQVARYIIRQLLKEVLSIPNVDEEHHLIKSAKQFIRGSGRGRGTNFQEENVYLRWERKGYRYDYDSDWE